MNRIRNNNKYLLDKYKKHIICYKNKFVIIKLFILIILFIIIQQFYFKKFENIIQISFNNYNNHSFMINDNKNHKCFNTKILNKRQINKKPLTINQVIYKLNRDYLLRKSKYILLFDFYNNPYCNDKNAYLIFQYLMERNRTDAYYVINIHSDLYKSLLKINKTQNLIIIDSLNNFYEKIYPYLLNSKIIINSFIYKDIHRIVSKVKFLKFLYITHAIGYFKKKIISTEFSQLTINKRNIIISSPCEYKLYKTMNKYNDSYMHKAGLPRYDRLISIKTNDSEKKCILISFTYRKYDNNIYNNSLLKKNLENLLSDKSLIHFLQNRNIDLIYIQHHFDFLRKRPFNPNNFPYIKYRNQTFLSHYIEHCSLLVTDFSTVSFDFMFLNKPVLFYLIDLKDNLEFEEKDYMKYDKNNNIFFGLDFVDKNLLIKKIKYYTMRNFKIENNLKKKYESLFYYKYNITGRVIDIINKIIES